MRTSSKSLILLGTLLSASGYGATFLISLWWRSKGGSDIDAGNTLAMALLGTLLGVPLVGWCAGKIDAARLAALGALTLGSGYALLGNLQTTEQTLFASLGTFLIGLGWGMFYLGAPMALSERVDNHERGAAFTRFSAFQMTGICGGPVLMTLAVTQSDLAIEQAFSWVAALGVAAFCLLAIFSIREPRHAPDVAWRPWMSKIITLGKGVAIRPIVMAGLGGAVFSGIMTFQSSLTEGTGAQANTFFAIHAATAVVARLLLAGRLSIWPRTPLIITLLSCLVAGVVSLCGLALHPGFHIAAAMLTGAGYGLLYPVIQTWAVNASAPQDRHAALTWFVIAYFIGIFGFPVVGGWLLVTIGSSAFLGALIVLGLLDMATAVVGVEKARPQLAV